MQGSIRPQHQTHQPGLQSEMGPAPISIRDTYKGSGKLAGKVNQGGSGPGGMERRLWPQGNHKCLIGS
jgi:hypothetical protein